MSDWPKGASDLERIVEQLPIGFIYLDRDFRVVRVNAELLRWVGLPAEEAVGRRCYELFGRLGGQDPLPTSPCGACRVPQAITKNRKQTFVNEVRPDFVVQNTTVPIEDESGEVVGTVELLEDITARRQAERVLRESHDELERRVAERTAQLEELNRVKELFVDIMRHDLTNPLQVARICHRHLRDEGHVAAEAGRYLDGLDDAVARAMKVVDDAATYGRLETLDHLQSEEVDLLDVIERTASSVELRHGAGSRVRMSSLGRYPVTGDPSLIELVLTNLVSNALAYSPAEAPVDLDVLDDGDGWVVRVADRGPGIPPEHRDTIFERFVRGDRGGVRGTGLGLAIARRVMGLHGGRLWVEPNPGGGSLFCARFPKR